MAARVGLFSLLLGGVCAQLEVTVDSPVAAQLGSQALLPCTFTVVDTPMSPEYLAVHWYFQDQELVSYDDSLNVFRPGASMDTEQLASGNTSLVLRNVTVSDQGAYRCLVIHSPDRGEQSLHLAVLAVPTVAVPSKAVLRGEPNLLKCSVSGFHPADITVTWLRAGEVLPASPLPTPQRNPDGTFNVSSSLTFQPTEQDQGVTFSCQVQHAAVPRGALQTDFQLIFGVSPMVNIHAPTFVQGKAQVLTCDMKGFYPEAIAVNWLLNGVRTEAPGVNPNGTFNLESFYQFKPAAELEGAEISCEVQHETLSRPIVRSVRVHLEPAHQTFAVSDIVGPKVWVPGEYVSLVCIGYHCPAGTKAKCAKCPNEKLMPIAKGDPAGSDGEEQLLVPISAPYKVQTQMLPLAKGSTTLATTLMFRVRSPEDLGARYQCCFISKDGRTLSTKEFGGYNLCPSGQTQGSAVDPAAAQPAEE
ncbi:tyrosine-protein phosphatase non-receptor type substrate 1-like [Chrysemys picta bellii]|uniref:tyrosine-protein phosphatase non-receptor type substrate 1-like n=1 Tax=Chrysemys picta bellii TaxID=8478 RepID=UPI0032B2AF00